MTVEELNIKITADAENFKNAIYDANAAMEGFRTRAAEAGREVTDAFSGLLEVGLVGTKRTPEPETVTPAEISGRADRTASFMESLREYEQPSAAGFAAYFAGTRNAVSGTVALPELDSREGGIGSSGGGNTEVQPVNITTTVELDGDKVGESVSSYFLRRSKITNGIGG